MHGASLVLQQQEHEACLRKKGHSFQQDCGWQKADLIISIVCLLGCGEKGQEPLSTLYLQRGASSCGIPRGSGRTALGMPSHTYQPHHSVSVESFHQPCLIHSQRKDLEIPYFCAGAHFYSEKQEKLSCISGPRISAVEMGCYGQVRVGPSKRPLFCGMNYLQLL